MTVIGIDLGTSCGWAVLDANGARLASGTFSFDWRRHEGGGMRYVRAGRRFGELLASYPDAVVAYEEVRRHRGTDAAHVYGGLLAKLSALCEERGVPYSGVSVGTIKSTATGKGNAGKAAMVAAAVARWGVEGVGEDEADALWVAETWRQTA